MIFESPNKNGGKYQKPERIIVHAMSEFLPTKKVVHASQFLIDIGLSAHCLTTPSGDIIRCRDDGLMGYHAKGYNENSLGVEMLVSGLHTYNEFIERIKTDQGWCKTEQLNATIKLINDWMWKYSISKDKVFRHSDVDSPRKSDPGEAFPWTYFKSRIGKTVA